MSRQGDEIGWICKSDTAHIVAPDLIRGLSVLKKKGGCRVKIGDRLSAIVASVSSAQVKALKMSLSVPILSRNHQRGKISG